MNRQPSFFTSIPDSKDYRNQERIRVEQASSMSASNSSSFSGQGKQMKLDKLLATEEFQVKIQGITYCEELEILSIGLANGAVANYVLEIESESFFDPQEVETSLSPREGTKTRMSQKEQRQLLSKEGEVIASAQYITNEEDTPTLDVKNG